MRTPGIAGITSIDCAHCGHALRDYDAPRTVLGVTQVTARCHACKTGQRYEVDHGTYETWVTCLGQTGWEEQA
jgi:hypothetical protein